MIRLRKESKEWDLWKRSPKNILGNFKTINSTLWLNAKSPTRDIHEWILSHYVDPVGFFRGGNYFVFLQNKLEMSPPGEWWAGSTTTLTPTKGMVSSTIDNCYELSMNSGGLDTEWPPANAIDLIPYYHIVWDSTNTQQTVFLPVASWGQTYVDTGISNTSSKVKSGAIPELICVKFTLKSCWKHLNLAKPVTYKCKFYAYKWVLVDPSARLTGTHK